MRNFNSQEGVFKPVLRIKITPEGLLIQQSRHKNAQSRDPCQNHSKQPHLIFLLRGFRTASKSRAFIAFTLFRKLVQEKYLTQIGSNFFFKRLKTLIANPSRVNKNLRAAKISKDRGNCKTRFARQIQWFFWVHPTNAYL